MGLSFLVPPSVGVARAAARGELLASALAAEVGEPVEVRVAEDYAAIERAVLAGDAELVWAPAALCARLTGAAHAIYKIVRGGHASYRSALVGRQGSQLVLERLAGKHAAWVDPLSLGGYLLVAHHLRERGLEPDTTFASQRFLGSHPAALAEVLEGRADVAAVSVASDDREHVEQALTLHGGRTGALGLTAIAITDRAPTDALLFARGLDASRAAALAKRLFEGPRRPTSLCLAMEAEGFVRADASEYEALLPLLE